MESRLNNLLGGLDRAHGRTVVLDRVSTRKGKREARSWTLHEPVTEELWRQHLDGGIGLGVIPIRDDACAGWGAVDIDVYDLDLVRLEQRVEELGLPLVVCQTKSGGAHIFLFLSEPVDAALVREKMTAVAVALGYPGVEVFPKQVRLAHECDVGSWLNMPYQGARTEDGTSRPAIIGGEPVGVERFLALAEERRCSAEDVTEINPPNTGEISDGPPCLQHIAAHGVPEGQRNQSLFSFGVYCRLKYGDQWEDELERINRDLFDPPLPSREVQEVIKSLRAKEYRYKCSEPPLRELCNYGLCLGRTYGIGGGDETQDVQLGNLVKLLTQPPIYILDVDGYRLELTVDELLDHAKFRRKCLERLNKLPPRRKAEKWEATVQALINQVEEVEAPPDSTPEGRTLEMLREWATQYDSETNDKEALLLGRPFFDDEGRVVFRSGDFQTYLERQGIKEIRGHRLWAILRDHGATHGVAKVTGRSVRYWAVPLQVEEQDELTTPRREEEF